ncbi:MAG: hypothetical protein QM764_17630 [Chitinophagaceae bacterium]
MKARHALRLTGLVVSAIALGWITLRFMRSGALDLLASAPGGGSLTIGVIASAIVYAIASCVLVLAWWRLITTLAMHPIPALPLMATYAVSQYGKYLPGNVMHYAIRHAWSRRYGVAHAALALASLLEAALLVLSALCLTLLADCASCARAVDAGSAPRDLAGRVDTRRAAASRSRCARRRGVFERFHLPALPPVGCASVLRRVLSRVSVGVRCAARFVRTCVRHSRRFVFHAARARAPRVGSWASSSSARRADSACARRRSSRSPDPRSAKAARCC